ncbi:MAG: SMP-30/gluconolactonase/LRE family protein [Cyanobacteria bacterium]|nr:SMP-30/gluconolactonase/LRE family protein [Cyanobacteriota bacterium]
MNRTGRRHEIAPTPTEVSVVLRAKAQIGEGPVWDARSQRLYWVDIPAQQLHVFNPADGTNATYTCPDIVTSVSPRAGDGVLLTLRRSFAFFDEKTGGVQTIAEVEPGMPGNRFNDGKTDRRGRHWAGTMGDVDWNHPIGNLYRFGADRNPVRVEEKIRCSNGIAWSPDDRTMYFCESFAYVIHAYDFDAERGEIANRRTFAKVDDASFPDGITVDAEGFVWCGQPVFGRIVRYDPAGRIERIIELPVSRGTSVMFGGPDLSTLYVTTMRTTLDERQLAEEPLAGCVLAIRPGVKGLAETPFAG